MGSDSNGDKVIAVKSWQAFIGLLVTIVTLAGSILISYASMKTETEENTRQIRQIQEDTVKKEQLEDIRERLRRIERKLDHEEDLRVSHR